MIKLVPIYKIRIVYDSGYTHDFETYSFSYEQRHGVRFSWKSASDKNKPIYFGADNIIAVYQIGYRYALRWVSKEDTK